MTIEKLECTVRFGSEQVPLYRATWKRAPRQPYLKTYKMKPGDCWFDMMTSKQLETYALDGDGRAVPVDALVSQYLRFEGADEAVFVELWGGITIVNENLVCVDSKKSVAGTIIEKYIKQSEKPSAGGFPDVVAVFPDGRIVFREIKKKKSDRIQENQHSAADWLRRIHGSNADLAIIEWEPQ